MFASSSRIFCRRSTTTTALLLGRTRTPEHSRLLSSRYVHPEQALAEKRAKVLAEVKKQVAEQLKQKQQAEELAKNGISACAANNHPNHRLQIAKEKLTSSSESSQNEISPEILSRIREKAEQPMQRKNDGVSSGALAEKRLLEMRRKALEKVLMDAAKSTGTVPELNSETPIYTKRRSGSVNTKSKSLRKKAVVTVIPKRKRR